MQLIDVLVDDLNDGNNSKKVKYIDDETPKVPGYDVDDEEDEEDESGSINEFVVDDENVEYEDSVVADASTANNELQSSDGRSSRPNPLDFTSDWEYSKDPKGKGKARAQPKDHAIPKKIRKVPLCSTCKLPGHTKRNCPSKSVL